MLLTIRLERAPAEDLGWLLHKNPARPLQTFSLNAGRCHVFWPERGPEAATCALLLELDPVLLSRRVERPDSRRPLEPYVNDRPYVASSFLASAINDVFSTAIGGRCKERPELVDEALPLCIELAALPARGGPALIERLFAPLGYQIEATPSPGDEWCEGRVYHLRLRAVLRLSQVLRHLVVLIPALDDRKHHFVGEGEVQKLARLGEGWLGAHPELSTIALRYLRRRRSLAEAAAALLQPAELPPEEPGAVEEMEGAEGGGEGEVDAPETPELVPPEAPVREVEAVGLNEQRLATIAALLAQKGGRVLDLGCGEARLIQRLRALPHLRQIAGVDPAPRCLEVATRRLKLDHSPDPRIQLWLGSALYLDSRTCAPPGAEPLFDAVALVEVIEHMEVERLPSLVSVVFGAIRAPLVLVSTPNVEYNALYPQLKGLRHHDHRFEWSREQFEAWARQAAADHGYKVEFRPIGAEHPELGAPTQLGIFTR